MTAQNRSTISAFVITLNEERNIRRCLESLKWCDEIYVVDSGSSDETLSICREYTSNITVRQWPGFVAQKAFALSQCQCDWVLNLDADEEVSPELRDEILSVLQSSTSEKNPVCGYELLRVVFYLGKWWRKGGWHPEYRLRLMRRAEASWGGKDPHERAVINGRVARLKSELRHFTYDDIADHIRSLNTFSSVAARTMYRDGVRFSYLKLVVNPLARFYKFYLVKKGFLEGFAGLLVAHLEAYYVLLKYAKLWELYRNDGKNDGRDN